MHNKFRCGCGERYVCGTGDPEHDAILQQAMTDHAKMGHNILKPLKVPSNPIEAMQMTVCDDEDAECPDKDESYAYFDGDKVA